MPATRTATLTEQTCLSSIPISSLYESSDQSNHFKSVSYFNDGYAENCYLIDDYKEGC